MPTVSAVIPLYNGSRFIEEALQSVLSQTLPPSEIIVVDDGSTDDGAQIVRGMASRHSIKLLTKPNGGQSSARNFGIAHAKSDLIALLDQDDAWYPGHLEMLIKPFCRARFGSKLGWVYSNLDQIDLHGQMVCNSFLSTLPSPHPKRNIFECLQQDMFVLPSASLIDRIALEVVHGFDERLSGYEDDDLFLRLYRAGYDNIYINRALSRWRIHSGSSSYSPRMYRSGMLYARKLASEFPDEPEHRRFYVRDLIAPRFVSHALSTLSKAARAKDKEAARSALEDITTFKSGLRRQHRIALRLAMPFLRRPSSASHLIDFYMFTRSLRT